MRVRAFVCAYVKSHVLETAWFAFPRCLIPKPIPSASWRCLQHLYQHCHGPRLLAQACQSRLQSLLLFFSWHLACQPRHMYRFLDSIFLMKSSVFSRRSFRLCMSDWFFSSRSSPAANFTSRVAFSCRLIISHSLHLSKSHGFMSLIALSSCSLLRRPLTTAPSIRVPPRGRLLTLRLSSIFFGQIAAGSVSFVALFLIEDRDTNRCLQVQQSRVLVRDYQEGTFDRKGGGRQQLHV